MPKKLFSIFLFSCFSFMLIPFFQSASAAPPTTTTIRKSAARAAVCDLTITIIAAPFAVVDSNIPGVEGPMVGTIGARITNNSLDSLSDLAVHIGDGTTPGSFSTADGGALALLGQSTATYNINSVAAGATTTAYWQITYPPTYDVTYNYSIWGADQSGCSATDSATLTTQSEISASANKLLPTGSTIVIYPETAVPGTPITVQITGFVLGTIGKGPKPLDPYDAWLQPVGNLDFDPSCMRLINTEVYLHSVHASPQQNILYFAGLTSYSADPTDYVQYSFLPLQNCSTTIQPYQEAASGTQEKYNGDYSSPATRIAIVSSGDSAVMLTLTADNNAPAANDPIQYTTTFSTTSGIAGSPENGSPMVLIATIPPGSSYTAGSSIISTAAKTEFSTDGGLNWSTIEPVDPTTVTHIRWILSEPVDTVAETAGFAVTVNSSYAGTPLTATIEIGILDAPAIANDTLILNDSPATPTPTPSPTPDPGVGSGSEGGLESGPLDVPPSSFLGSTGESSNVGNDSYHKARLQEVQALTLLDILPSTGPSGTIPSNVIPVDVLAATDSPDAQAVDFLNGQNEVQAVVLGIQSYGGPYEHDYGVCNRFKGYQLDGIAPASISGIDQANIGTAYWFWHADGRSESSAHEEALLFHVFVDETNKAFHIDSRWIKDSYTTTLPFTYDYVFNLQVWSGDYATSEALLAGIIDQLYAVEGGSWQLTFHNDTAPTTPQIFIRETIYDADIVRLKIDNQTGGWQTADFYGSWRRYTERNISIPVTSSLNLPPGRSTVSFPFDALLDTTLYLEYGGFTDKIYNGGGLWFDFSNSITATTTMSPGSCRSLEGIPSEDLLLAGCIDFSSSNVTQSDEAGVGRTLNPNGRPVDVSPYAALRFWAKGDGHPIRILLETDNVTDGDFYQLVFTPQSDWSEYTLPLSSFAQRGFGAAVPFTGVDLKTVIWLNADGTGGNFQLSLDQVRFTNQGIVQLVQAPTGVVDGNSQPVMINIPAGAASSAVWYSVDRGVSFTALPLSQSGTQFSAAFPAQPFGTDIFYYFESQDIYSNTSRLPLDAPASLYRYRVDDRLRLLIDDFYGSRLENRVGGTAGLFNNPAGGDLQAYRLENQLILVYGVTAPGEAAGYFTQFPGTLNAASYNTINLLVKGAQGGEQLLLSVKDQSGYEPRLNLGDLIPGGLSTEWRWVQIPLANFPAQLDRTSLQTLALSFAQGQGTASGIVYVREIALTMLEAPMIVDTFDDGNGAVNSHGWAYQETAVNSSLASSYSPTDAQYQSGFSLQLDYAVNAGGYALWETALTTASATPGQPVNSSANLSFWVRGLNLDLIPNIYLSDHSGGRTFVPLADYASPTAVWQQIQIPLTAFTSQGVDPQKLDKLQLAFEFGSGSGTLWLDNVYIGDTVPPQAEQRVVHLGARDSWPIALHMGDGSGWSSVSDQSWLYTDPAVGAGPASILLETYSGLLPPAQYNGSVIFTNDAGSETVTVVMNVTQAPQIQQIFLPLIQR